MWGVLSVLLVEEKVNPCLKTGLCCYKVLLEALWVCCCVGLVVFEGLLFDVHEMVGLSDS